MTLGELVALVREQGVDIDAVQVKLDIGIEETWVDVDVSADLIKVKDGAVVIEKDLCEWRS